MTGGLILQIIMGGSLELLWALLNTLQFLAFMPLLNLRMPKFLQLFFENLNSFNFMMVDFTDLLTSVFSFTSSLQSWGSNFEIVGFETSNIFINASDIFMLLLGFLVVLTLGYIGIKVCRQRPWLKNKIIGIL